MASKQNISKLVELSEIISKNVAELQKVLDNNHAASPSLDEDAPTHLPNEVQDVQDAIIDASLLLHDILLEPLSLLYKKGAPFNNVALQAVARLEIPKLVPENGEVPFADIAKSVGLPEPIVARLLRMAITLRIFQEPRPSFLAHSKISKFLKKQEHLDWLRCGTDELWITAPRILDGIQKWPEDQVNNHTAFQLAYETDDHFYTYWSKHPEKAARFGNVMQTYVANGPEYNLSFLADNYDWSSLGSAKVVELGGQFGHVAMSLSRRFPDLNFTVQDIDAVIRLAAEKLPNEFRDRVSFEAHEFFSDQKSESRDVDVFYSRWIYHNWPDRDCVKLLRSLIPALRPGSRVLIQDTCMPEPGAIAHWKEADLRVTDITMEGLFKSRERTAPEWKALIAEADPRFKLVNITEPKGSALSLFDVRWSP